MNIRKSPLNKLMPSTKSEGHSAKSTHSWLNLKSSIVITMISLFCIGTGCKNLAEADVSLTGLELEWYEPPPVTIVYTNLPVAAPSKLKLFPTLMEMDNK